MINYQMVACQNTKISNEPVKIMLYIWRGYVREKCLSAGPPHTTEPTKRVDWAK